MKLKMFVILAFLFHFYQSDSQVPDTINKTDSKGLKQGHWIKKYPGGSIQYDGYFKDNLPVGSFKRYYENDTLQSILIFSPDSKSAEATLFHPNGFIASTGKYVSRMKEGLWKFYSSRIKGYLVSTEEYKSNKRDGSSVKFYQDGRIAEKVTYLNDMKNGEWDQYYPNGTNCLRANYLNGKLNGSFVVWSSDGKPEYIGQYKEDLRDGSWKIYNSNGTLKYNIEYKNGIASGSEKFKKESDYLDSLERNKGKIADPAITGTLKE